MLTLRTRFTELVGCTVPLQQAGMGPVGTLELVAAVADAGALGMLGGTGLPPHVLAERIDRLRERTVGTFGVNFLMPFLDRACVEVAAAGARVVEFFYGDPDAALVELVHRGGALACWQVGSRTEAVAAEAAGCDLIVAQGIEAGGHVRGRIGLLPLLGEVLDAVAVPVLAAGGIGTGRALAAVLAAGAAGARVGTRFVAAQEAGAHPAYVARLIAAEAADTVYTEAFAVGWPHAPHRVLRTSLEAAQAFAGEVVGEMARPRGDPIPVYRFQGNFVITKQVTGAIEAMPHWAGESVGAVRRVQPAGEIVRELADDAAQLLRRGGATARTVSADAPDA